MGYFYTAHDVGVLHMESERSSGTLIRTNDSTIAVAWESIDYTPWLPKGVRALLLKIDVTFTNAANDKAIAVFRDYGVTYTPGEAWSYCACPHLLLAGELGTNNGRGSCYGMMVTDGRFDYAGYHANWLPSTVQLQVQGYYL